MTHTSSHTLLGTPTHTHSHLIPSHLLHTNPLYTHIPLSHTSHTPHAYAVTHISHASHTHTARTYHTHSDTIHLTYMPHILTNHTHSTHTNRFLPMYTRRAITNGFHDKQAVGSSAVSSVSQAPSLFWLGPQHCCLSSVSHHCPGWLLGSGCCSLSGKQREGEKRTCSLHVFTESSITELSSGLTQ